MKEQRQRAWGKSVSIARARARITTTELAERTGLARATIERLESGKHAPRIVTQVLISDALGVALDDLFPEEAA